MKAFLTSKIFSFWQVCEKISYTVAVAFMNEVKLVANPNMAFP